MAQESKFFNPKLYRESDNNVMDKQALTSEELELCTKEDVSPEVAREIYNTYTDLQELPRYRAQEIARMETLVAVWKKVNQDPTVRLEEQIRMFQEKVVSLFYSDLGIFLGEKEFHDNEIDVEKKAYETDFEKQHPRHTTELAPGYGLTGEALYDFTQKHFAEIKESEQKASAYNGIEKYYRLAADIKRVSPTVEQQAFTLVASDDRTNQEMGFKILFYYGLPTVLHAAQNIKSKYDLLMHAALAEEDLIAGGCARILHLIEKYKTEAEEAKEMIVKNFPTYIYNEIQLVFADYINRQTSIPIGWFMSGKSSKILSYIKEYFVESSGHYPTVEEIAEACRIRKKGLDNVTSILSLVRYGQEKSGISDKSELLSSSLPSQEQLVLDEELRTTIKNALKAENVLTREERLVITLYYGLGEDGPEPQSFRKIGRQLVVSHETVRKTFSNGLKKLCAHDRQLQKLRELL